MPIDHPSDLPDDADRADEWQAAEDSQAPGGRRPNPAEQTAEQTDPSPDERPGARSKPSSDAPAADNDRPDPGEQRADDERHAPDTQPVDSARPDASTVTAEAPDPPEAAAEPRTRQEHADTDRPEKTGETEYYAVDAGSEESLPDQAQSADPPIALQQPDSQQSANDADYPAEVEDTDHVISVTGVDPAELKDQLLEPAIENDTDKSPRQATETEPQVEMNSTKMSPNLWDEIGNDANPGRKDDANLLLPGEFNAKDSAQPDRQTLSGSITSTDNPVHPLSNTEWAEHVTEVIDRLGKARAAGLETHLLYTIDPDNQSWSRERRALHTSIINDLYDKARTVPNEGSAIIAGGLGGAGKTTILTNYANIDTSRFLIINPDNLKEEMARRGMIPPVEGLSPMEASELVHEESSYLARQLAMRAQVEEKNLIWDITMSDREKTAKRIDDLRASGYTSIEGIFVDIPAEKSIQRTESRHREGHEKYRAGEGVGGRYVPREVVERQEDPQWGSTNKKTFYGLTDKFNHWSVYDNSIDGRPAILIESGRHHN